MRLGIAFFMKQMTRKKPIPADLFVREIPSASRCGPGRADQLRLYEFTA
jgi:hypothetical protein